jgi:hypothetical protein
MENRTKSLGCTCPNGLIAKKMQETNSLGRVRLYTIVHTYCLLIEFMMRGLRLYQKLFSCLFYLKNRSMVLELYYIRSQIYDTVDFFFENFEHSS